MNVDAVIAANAPYWGAEAEICRTYFRSPGRSAESDARWIARQAAKELLDGHPDDDLPILSRQRRCLDRPEAGEHVLGLVGEDGATGLGDGVISVRASGEGEAFPEEGAAPTLAHRAGDGAQVGVLLEVAGA